MPVAELPCPKLWLCADLSLASADAMAPRLEALLARYAVTVWLRLPAGVDASAVLALGERLLAACKAHDSALVVGDRVDLALALGAQGIHLSARGPGPDEVRRLLSAVRKSAFLSASVHDAGGVSAIGPLVDVLVLSPFGEVPGKGAALGAGGFAGLRALAPGVPVVALGGILGAADAVRARAAGAQGVAVRRTLMGAESERVCGELVAALG